MRIAQTKEEEVFTTHVHFQKSLDQGPKPSLTELHVKQLTYWNKDPNMPVTRVELMPHTGRTHELRVHTAALGFPTAGDDIYGYAGEGDCGVTINNDDAAADPN